MRINNILALMIGFYTISGASGIGGLYYVTQAEKITQKYHKHYISEELEREMIKERNYYFLPASILAPLCIASGVAGLFTQLKYKEQKQLEAIRARH